MPASHSIIDMHTHIMPPEWEDIGSRFGIDGWLWVRRESSTRSTIMQGERKFRVVTDQSFSPERHIADMDAQGIGRHLLQPIPVMFCYREPPEATAEFAMIHNDFIAQAPATSPDLEPHPLLRPIASNCPHELCASRDSILTLGHPTKPKRFPSATDNHTPI